MTRAGLPTCRYVNSLDLPKGCDHNLDEEWRFYTIPDDLEAYLHWKQGCLERPDAWKWSSRLGRYVWTNMPEDPDMEPFRF